MNLARTFTRSFAVLLALLLFITGFSLLNFRQLRESEERKKQNYIVLLETQRFQQLIFQMDASARAYALVKTPSERTTYQQELEKSLESWKRLKELAANQPEQLAKLDEIGQLRQQWIDESLEPVIRIGEQISDSTIAGFEIIKLAPQRRLGLQRINTAIAAVEQTERASLQERELEQAHWQRLTQITLWVGSVFSVLLSGILLLWVNNATKNLDSANARLSHINKELESTNAALLSENQQRRAAEEKLRESVVELERSNEELSQFAYVASHDLQEPLRAVAGCVQVLKKRYSGQLDARADQFIDHAVDGSQRMQNLINDLLSYSRVGTKGKPFETVAADKILDGALRNLSASIDESGIQIVRAPLPEIRCDAGQIEQVFQNLISNAIKFRGEHEPKVEISCELRDNEHVFSIRDNGPGIEPQYFERIFVMFQRLHTRVEYPGTGIGLAICKKIVERHGGKIWVESHREVGSTFFFSIPVSSESTQPEPEPDI